jgi:hypothetical protein
VIFTGSTSKTDIGLGNVDNTSDAGKPVSTATQTALNLKANLASPTFTGTVSGVTKSMVGLGNVDNTSDAGKPVSTATQTALDLKANLASPTFTGTVSGVTKSMVGLGNVDNTTDASKPVSTATQTALDLKLTSTTAASTYLPISNPTATGTMTAPTISNTLGANFATSSGNVGIGTSSPAYKLDVSGSFNANSIYTKDDQNGYAGNYGRYSVAYPYATFSTSGAWGYDWQVSGSSKMRLFSNGNLGIGAITDEGFKLDLQGNSRVTGFIRFGVGYLSGAFISSTRFKSSSIGATYFDGTNWITPSMGSNAVRLIASDQDGIGFYTQASIGATDRSTTTATMETYKRLTIADDGNIGIGILAPTYKTHIYGVGEAIAGGITNAGAKGASLYIQDQNSTSYSGGSIVFGASQGAGAAIKYEITDGGINTTGDLSFQVRNNTTNTSLTTAVHIKSTGNIGIGTLTPAQRLDVVGIAQATQFKLSALNTAPASSSAAGTVGEIRVDASYIYICTATNTWKRSAITTW